MNKNLVSEINASQLRKDLPAFNSGDTIKIAVKIREGEKERIQYFEGVVIALQGSGVNRTFTVRKMSSGIGVERVFMTHSPVIEGIEVLRRGKVRRNKIYYIRKLSGRKARIKEKR
ncbi:MAG: 50S ribosomal protein L19 [Bacilli bacterium]